MELGLLPINMGGINILALTGRPIDIEGADLEKKAYKVKNYSKEMRPQDGYFVINQFIIKTGKEFFFPQVEIGQSEVLVKDEEGNIRYTIYISDDKKKGYKHIYGRHPYCYVFIKVVDANSNNVNFGQLINYP